MLHLCLMPPSLAKSTQKPAFRLTEEISGLIEATEIQQRETHY